MSKILLDVDGVVSDMVPTLFEEMSGDLKVEDFPDWDIFSQMTKEQQDEAYKILEDPLFWTNLPLIDGAKKAVRLLKAAGHDIVWVTTPWDSCRGWGDARRFWIRENFGDDRVVATHDKEKEDGDVFIDDKPSNVKRWAAAHPDKKAFIFDTPHNKKYTGAPRFSWDKVEKLL